MPADLPDRAGTLNNLGIALRRRFTRTGLMEDLDQAIEASEQAIELMSVDHPNRAAWLNNLSIALQARLREQDRWRT